MRGSRVRRLLGALGVVLALALAACGQTPGDIPLIGSPVPTFTLAPAGQLNWQPHLPPVVGIPQLASLFNDPTLALAPSDSRVAYECVAAARFGAPGAQVWTTHDGASHWKRAADLVSGGVVDSCPISVDGLNPMRAVALTFRDAHDQCMACGDGTYINFLTEDGGATWAPVRGPADTVHQLATFRGNTYALWFPHPADLSTLHSALVVSHDGLRSWTPIDGAFTAGNGQNNGAGGRFATQFWVNPASGALLALTSTSWVNSGQFWASNNGGQTWTQLRTPAADDYIVESPVANDPWQICGLHTSTSNAQPTIANVLTCTTDGGHNWVDRGGDPGQASIFAIAADGSILEDAPAADWTPGTNGHFALRRLAPGASEWVSLGPIPSTGGGFQITYVAGTGSGTVWEFTDSGGIKSTAPTIAQMMFYSVSYA